MSVAHRAVSGASGDQRSGMPVAIALPFLSSSGSPTGTNSSRAPFPHGAERAAGPVPDSDSVRGACLGPGYRPDYSRIHLPVLGPDGLPRHQRGVTESPGLFFLGMHNQYSRGSSLIHWVRHDAAYITRPGPGTRHQPDSVAGLSWC